mmetsp:Transcript_59473/g.141658  ORF Transcript_59473/g.141658 Transcript_59473/m.141658 type:complete len:125 (-) Transcript_59473:201-575(-)
MDHSAAGREDVDEAHPIAEDVEHYKENYRDFFSAFEVLWKSPSGDEATFRVSSRTNNKRTLKVRLTSRCFVVEEDSMEGKLKGRELETFEQLLSAMDGAEVFGTTLCSLVEAKLAQLAPREDDS